ncbi:phage GP46 family protein [Cupriavidus gilardii]|uniref:phage GP46 family protein n=1 Tax=Cupriavidus gilardii TaxID=82541 RepID=UPI0007E30188|nr:phage GP46 family protein [Cupriavidus gilardii]
MTTTLSDNDALLYRAVVISLFTWRRAEPDDLLDDDQRMGWWGDSYPAIAGDRIGSRLWLLRRRTLTPEVLRLAVDYAHEALRWMVEDGLAARVAVQAFNTVRGRLDLLVTLYDDAGGTLAQFNFNDLWRVTHAI